MLRDHSVIDSSSVSTIRTSLQQKITELYSTLLAYQMKSVCAYYRHHRLITAVKDQLDWNDWEGNVSEVKLAEESLRQDATAFNQQLSLEFQSAESHHWPNVLDKFEALVQLGSRNDERETHREDREFQKMKEQSREKTNEFIARFSIAGLEDFKNVLNRKPAANTCRWFKEHPSYLEWNAMDAAVMVVSAPPGTGKSVLARSIIDELRDQHSGDYIICHFFFKDSSPIQSSAVYAVRALVHQVLRELPVTAFQLAEEMATVSIDAMLSDFATLWGIFVRAVRSPEAQSKRVACILDALDECEGRGRDRLIDFIDEHSQGPQLSSLKLLVTARPYESILNSFGRFQSHFINLETGDDEIAKISEEINLVIDERLEQLATRKRNRPPPNVIEEIRKKLRSTQNRTYLWLRLIFELLDKNWKNTSQKDWLKPVREIPQTLNEVYESLLKKVDGEDVCKVQTILSMVVAAFRPLSVEELKAALDTYSAVDETESPDSPVSDSDSEFLEPTPDPTAFTTWLVNACGFAIHVFDGHVFFIHQTVKEFLVCKKRSSDLCPGDNTAWKCSIELELAHATLAETCILYASQPPLFAISTPIPSLRPTRTWAMTSISENFEKLLQQYFQQFPLLHYSYAWWAEHLRLSQKLDDKEKAVHLAVDSHPKLVSKYVALLYEPSLLHHFSWLAINSSQYRCIARYPQYWRDRKWKATQGKASFAAETGHFILINEVLGEITNHEDAKATILSMLSIVLQNNFLAPLRVLLHHPSCPELSPHASELLSQCSSAEAALLLKESGLDLNTPILTSRGSTLLHRLCQTTLPKDIETVRRLLKLGVSPDIRDRTGETPLHRCKTAEVATALIRAGLNIEIENKDGCTAMHSVVGDACIEVLEALIRAKADLDSPDHTGSTPIHKAIHPKGVDALEALIKAGSNINAEDQQGNTALHKAIHFMRMDCVKSLLAAGATTSVKNRDGDSIVDVAYRLCQSLSSASDLFQAGLKVSSRDSAGNTALHWAAQGWHPESHLVLDYVLLDTETDVYAKNLKGKTALHHATSAAKVEALLNAGASIGACDGNGNTSLHDAAAKCNREVVESLLLHGADIDCRNERQATPLHLCRKRDMVNLLTAKGCDVNARDVDGYSALHSMLRKCAIYDTNINSLRFTVSPSLAAEDDGGEWENIDESEHSDEWEDGEEQLAEGQAIIRTRELRPDCHRLLPPLIRAGATVNGSALDGFSPIHHAALSSLESLTCLLRAGADVSATLPTGETLFEMVAAVHELHDSAKWLKLALLVSPENKDGLVGDSISFLQHICAAARRPNFSNKQIIESLRSLLDAGADPDHSHEGVLPLQMLVTAEQNRNQCARLLLERGADPNAIDQDRDGQSTVVAVLELLEKKIRARHKELLMVSAAISPLQSDTRTLRIRSIILDSPTPEMDTRNHHLFVYTSPPPEIVKLELLLEFGAHVSTVTATGESLFLVAKASLLYPDHAPSISDIWTTCLQKSFDVNLQRSPDGNSALHLICQDAFSPALGVLNSTSLRQVAILTWQLVEFKADPNIRNQNLETPLFALTKAYCSTSFSNPFLLLEMARVLLTGGADPRLAAKCGCTPFDILSNCRIPPGLLVRSWLELSSSADDAIVEAAVSAFEKGLSLFDSGLDLAAPGRFGQVAKTFEDKILRALLQFLGETTGEQNARKCDVCSAGIVAIHSVRW